MFAARAPAHGAHLDLLGATSEASGLASGVLWTFALGRRVLTHGRGSDYMHVGGAGMHLGRVVGIRDIVVGRGGGAVWDGETREGGRCKGENSLVKTVGHYGV